MGFPPFVNSDHIVSVSTDFPITPKQDASFHGMAYDHSHADWDIPTLLLLLLVNFVSWFKLELMYISLIVSIRSNLTHLHGV